MFVRPSSVQPFVRCVRPSFRFRPRPVQSRLLRSTAKPLQDKKHVMLASQVQPGPDNPKPSTAKLIFLVQIRLIELN